MAAFVLVLVVGLALADVRYDPVPVLVDLVARVRVILESSS